MALGLCAAWLAVQLTARPSTSGTSYILLVGFLLLPFLNAPFDWFSIGLTRRLLRKNSIKSSLWWRLGFSLLDFLVAGAVMVILAATLICFLEFINATGAAKGLPWPVADIGGTLQGIQDNPWAGGNMWVYFTLFSTLIPTLIHLGIFLFSVMCSYRTSVSAWAYRKMCEVHKGERTKHKLAAFLAGRLGIAIALTVVIGLALIWGFMNVFSLGSHFLEFLQGVQVWSEATFTAWMSR